MCLCCWPRDNCLIFNNNKEQMSHTSKTKPEMPPFFTATLISISFEIDNLCYISTTETKEWGNLATFFGTGVVRNTTSQAIVTLKSEIWTFSQVFAEDPEEKLEIEN